MTPRGRKAYWNETIRETNGDEMTDGNMVKTKGFIRSFLAACLIAWNAPIATRADSTATREYQLKAAFLYNFILFVDGERFAPPDEEAANTDSNKPIWIGILGTDPFGDALAPLENKEVRNRPVAIQRFEGLAEFVDAEGRVPNRHPELERIKDCHVLFVCRSDKQHIARILKPLRKRNLLTVADTPGFLEAGGMVNFLIENKRVRFEINMAAAQRAGLQVRSQLLRLAKRILRTDAFQGHNNDEGHDTTN